MARAIVPAQAAAVRQADEAQREDAFEVGGAELHSVVIVGRLVEVDLGEEVRRWELFLIAHEQKLFSAGDCAVRIRRLDL